MYPLSIAVAVFSGGWPYIKLLIMLYCWTAPCPRQSDVTRRGRLLHVVDALGKWSLIDIYVMVRLLYQRPHDLGVVCRDVYLPVLLGHHFSWGRRVGFC